MKTLLPILLLASLPLSAASFVTVVCTAPYGLTAVYSSTDISSSCGTATASNGASTSAVGSVSLLIASDPASFSSLSTSQGLHAGSTFIPGEINPSSAAASVSINYSTTVSTLGGSRAGFLQLQAGGTGGQPYDGSIGIRVGLGSPNLTGYQTIQSCDPRNGCLPGPAYLNYIGLIPVELGTSFSLSAIGSASVGTDRDSGFSGGSLSTTYNFRFFEADGVTPVAVSAVPEPSSYLMLVSGALLLTMRKFVGRKSKP